MFTEAHLKAYKNHLEASYKNQGGYVESGHKIHFKKGSKYVKVTWGVNGPESAYAFIVVQEGQKFPVGTILKAASWAAPANNFGRGNVMNPESYKNHHWSGL